MAVIHTESGHFIAMPDVKSAVHYVKFSGCVPCVIENENGRIVRKYAAQQSVHLTAFGAGGRGAIPLQLSLFADDQSATIGGR